MSSIKQFKKASHEHKEFNRKVTTHMSENRRAFEKLKSNSVVSSKRINHF